MTISPTTTRKANLLIKDLATKIKDIKAWRKTKGAKKRWSAHTQVQETQQVNDITQAFENLEAFLKKEMPAHWQAQKARFHYTKAYTSWTWQVEKPNSNQNSNPGLTQNSLSHLVGFILGLVELSKTTGTETDAERLKNLNIDTKAVNTYSLFIKVSAKRTAKGNAQGTTPQDAYTQRVLDAQAPYGMVNVPMHNKGRKTHLKLAIEFAKTVFDDKQWAWSGAPTAMPKLFEHPNLTSIFGDLRYNGEIISASTHNPADYDKLLIACIKMADKVDSKGPLAAYLVFTSPIQSQSVLARCETGAKMVYLFSKLCHPIKGPLPTSASDIQHVCRLG